MLDAGLFISEFKNHEKCVNKKQNVEVVSLAPNGGQGIYMKYIVTLGLLFGQKYESVTLHFC